MSNTPQVESVIDEPAAPMAEAVSDTQERIRALEKKIDALGDRIISTIEKRDRRNWHAVYEMATNVTAVLKKIIS